MALKYVKPLVASLLIFPCIVFSKDRSNGELTVYGSVTFRDGSAFAYAIVNISELRDRLLAMPSVAQRVQVTADQEGRFSTTLKNVRGVLDVSAEHEKCMWTRSAVVHLERKDWQNNERINIDLKAVKGECSELPVNQGNRD